MAGGGFNWLREGVRNADAVTTVSPTYAAEIATPAGGHGLDGVLRSRRDGVVGILNGVDYEVWSPATDPFIDVRYDAAHLGGKYRLKGALSVALGLLPDQNAPLIGLVSRLASQKGIDLVAAVLPTLLRETRANFALLGSGDAQAIFAAYRAARSAARTGASARWNTAKLLVVGDEYAGKTSLIRFLARNEPRDLGEKKTRGIELQERVDLTTWAESGSGIMLNIWDFAGQVRTHGMHRYFFSQRCLYLLVLQDRRDETRAGPLQPGDDEGAASVC